VSQDDVRYDASRIEVLEGLEAIRRRPGMYIGSTGERGLHHLVFEVTGRAVNEVLAGRASRVEVVLTPDGDVRVADDGSAVAFEGAGDTGGAGLEALLTRLPAGGSPVGREAALLGFSMGLFIPNALSSRLTAEIRSEGELQLREYARGVALAPPTGPAPATGSGTTITFRPDADIFGTARCSYDALADRFRELAFTNPGLDISLADRRDPAGPREARFRYPGGVRDFVAFLDELRVGPRPHPDVIAFELEDRRMAGTMEVAFRWSASPESEIRSFANSRPTGEGGTHVLGFRDGVSAAVNTYARQQGLLTAGDPDLDGDRIAAGLTAVVSVKLDNPEFEGATRGRLGNTAARACVEQASRARLAAWLTEHPQQASAVIGSKARRA
jgi:DNA gyrase subunit B